MPNHIVDVETHSGWSLSITSCSHTSQNVYTSTFNMRMNLAIMDWNENVRRECTSERLVQGMRRPDRRTHVRVLVEKSFNFAGEIWENYEQQRKVDLSEFVEDVQPEQSDEPVDENEDLLNDGVHVLDEGLYEDI
ncbi:uncharacterized protein LOC135342508 [Halichondria panicea]|uniref:uncharacterized protein LOC135342508 n=1 Tax=Halichondria panicea TaxID=6063 RepID=UPI00312B9218